MLADVYIMSAPAASGLSSSAREAGSPDVALKPALEQIRTQNQLRRKLATARGVRYIRPGYQCFESLEGEAHTELKLAHGIRAEDFTESARSGGDGAAGRRAEAHDIEDIVGIGTKLKVRAFSETTQSERSRDCQVDVLENSGRATCCGWSLHRWKFRWSQESA